MLLDSNILIDLLRGRAEAKRFIQSLSKRPSTSVICAMELLAGARSRAEERSIDKLFQHAPPFDVTDPIARRAGQFLKHYRNSHGVTDPDALIAATAEHHGLVLATRNVKHFPMFPELVAAY
jgi:predicted nucleic acid-binding protein